MQRPSGVPPAVEATPPDSGGVSTAAPQWPQARKDHCGAALGQTPASRGRRTPPPLRGHEDRLPTTFLRVYTVVWYRGAVSGPECIRTFVCRALPCRFSRAAVATGPWGLPWQADSVGSR